jgi:outer membrane immunogenic protein
MKRLLGGIALSALLAAPAMAADLRMPVKAAPVVVAAYNWSGCYIGGHVGYLRADKGFVGDNPGTPTFGLDRGSHDADGVLAGGQVGCNYQTGSWVFGIQGDGAWSNADGSHTDPLNNVFGWRTEVEWLVSVTGRVGYAFDRLLLYVKGGYAWERDRHEVLIVATGAVDANARVTRGGWTVGGGAEYGLTPNWSIFAEYNYYDFGDKSVTFHDAAGAFYTRARIDETKHVAKIGLNWRWGANPVVARY